MAEHHASVTINAPADQVYALFTHFNDFPKFMRFVKEVTYYDTERSHWVVQVRGHYEWDAINEDWIEGRQIGWRSIRGLQNTGKVKFRSIGPNQTIVDVYIHYTPPTGPLGKLGEKLGVDSYFDTVLQADLNHFARMVEQAPPGALDPMSSHYLFHSESAVAKGRMTVRQKISMARDPMMSREALQERQARIEREAAKKREAQMKHETAREHKARMEREAQLAHQTTLEREAERERQAKLAREAEREQQAKLEREALEKLHPVHRTLGGRNASMLRTAFGDRDARGERHPLHEHDPMTARYPLKNRDTAKLPAEDMEGESHWKRSIRGTSSDE